MYNVIFHLDEVEKWSTVLGNITNLLKAAETEGWVVEVLINGAAVGVFKQNHKVENYATAMEKLADRGVKFSICQNSLRSFDIDSHGLPDYVTTVPAGVVYLVQMQYDGYAYIRP
ncbi:MAG TPA: hypothetical protein GX717_02250 [Clostridiaceae bacterium]|nr:hypothetical protein [Clostridiaceae bacterium]